MMPQIRNYRGGIMSSVVTAYVGPGDVVSGAAAWWGLRAYSSATTGSKAVRLRASGDNAESDFVTLSIGSLDVASISAFLTLHGGSLFVVTLYDQTGNGLDVTQATSARQPAFTLSGLGSLPVISVLAANDQGLGATTGLGNAVPYTMTTVQNYTNTGALQQRWFDFRDAGSTVIQLAQWRDPTNLLDVGSGSSWTVSPGSWHSTIPIEQAPNPTLYLDGIDQGGIGGVTTALPAAAGNLLHVTGFAGVGVPATTLIGEIGLWPGVFNATQAANMSANQHAYWGF